MLNRFLYWKLGIIEAKIDLRRILCEKMPFFAQKCKFKWNFRHFKCAHYKNVYAGMKVSESSVQEKKFHDDSLTTTLPTLFLVNHWISRKPAKTLFMYFFDRTYYTIGCRVKIKSISWPWKWKKKIFHLNRICFFFLIWCLQPPKVVFVHFFAFFASGGYKIQLHVVEIFFSKKHWKRRFQIAK